MLFSGDTHVFALSIIRSDGSNPTVSSVPQITILNMVTQEIVQAAVEMTLIVGSQKVYVYPWNSTGMADGGYVALVSYAADGVTVNARMLETIVLGNSRVTGMLALDATVAKESTAAKDATVMKFTDYQPPQLSPTILAIKSAVERIPQNPATAEALTAIDAKLEDVHDVSVGTWELNRSTGAFTMKRKNGTVLQSFYIERNDTQDNRIRA